MITACLDRGLDSSPIQLRFIRIDLPSGETEVLATSLIDANVFPHSIFEGLYRKRWPVEEDYKLLKCRMEIENFTGKTIHSIYQDCYAAIVAKNLTAMFSFEPSNQLSDQKTINGKERKHKKQINQTFAISIVRSRLPRLLSCGKEEAVRIIQYLQEQIFRITESIRPNRKNPRKAKTNKRVFYSSYKRAA